MKTYLTNLFARRVAGITPQALPIPGAVANSAGGHAVPVDDWARLDRFLILGSEGGSDYAGERVPTLLRVGLPVVADHFGLPDWRLGVDDPGFRHLLEMGATGRVWVKLSGAYRISAGDAGKSMAAAAEKLRLAFGPEWLLWGSDWPHTQFEATANTATARHALVIWLPGPAERKVVLADTPARLFRFLV